MGAASANRVHPSGSVALDSRNMTAARPPYQCYRVAVIDARPRAIGFHCGDNVHGEHGLIRREHCLYVFQFSLALYSVFDSTVRYIVPILPWIVALFFGLMPMVTLSPALSCTIMGVIEHDCTIP